MIQLSYCRGVWPRCQVCHLGGVGGTFGCLDPPFQDFKIVAILVCVVSGVRWINHTVIDLREEVENLVRWPGWIWNLVPRVSTLPSLMGVTNRCKPCSTNARKQTREAFIRHIIFLNCPMATPMSETEAPDHIVVVNPAEQQQEVTIVPSQSIVIGSVENAFATTDIP